MAATRCAKVPSRGRTGAGAAPGSVARGAGGWGAGVVLDGRTCSAKETRGTGRPGRASRLACTTARLTPTDPTRTPTSCSPIGRPVAKLRPGNALDDSWGRMGRSSDALDDSWGRMGRSKKASDDSLGRKGRPSDALNDSLGRKGRPSDALNDSWGRMGRSSDALDDSWGRMSRSSDALNDPWGRMKRSSNPLDDSWGRMSRSSDALNDPWGRMKRSSNPLNGSWRWMNPLEQRLEPLMAWDEPRIPWVLRCNGCKGRRIPSLERLLAPLRPGSSLDRSRVLAGARRSARAASRSPPSSRGDSRCGRPSRGPGETRSAETPRAASAGWSSR